MGGKEDLPRDFEIDFYRAAYSDLASLSDTQLLDHYHTYGIGEGRAASPAAFQSGLITCIPQGVPTLEIGPFCNPTLRGPEVRYFDVSARDGLLERARFLQAPVVDPPKIDYVSPEGDLRIIGDRFEQVFSAHCVEHQPDLVRHLNDVSALLPPSGRYYLVIPDKRYCYDHFMTESSLVDVIDAHLEDRMVHTAKSVIAASALVTHNDAARHWRGEHGKPAMQTLGLNIILDAVQAIHQANGRYIDVHGWYFTPKGFRAIVDGLQGLGLITLQTDRVYETPFGIFEFCAVLKKFDIRSPG